MRSFVATTLVAGALAWSNYESVKGYSFMEYVVDFGKDYGTMEEFDLHKSIFESNVARITAHNSNPEHSWKMGANKFTDMHRDELKAYRGYNHGMALTSTKPRVSLGKMSAPDSMDWRTKGAVSPVKDQKSCGSCWAFATTETIESHLAIATGETPLILSPQNVVSCTQNPNHCGGTGGCDGATSELGFDYVNKSGIALEADWPYSGTNGICKDPSVKKVVTVGAVVQLKTNSYQDLLNALGNVGPVAISVDASNWFLYTSGVYDGCSKTEMDIDHAVQAVGYGTDDVTGEDYWIVRNSWGPDWGEKGFIRLKRNSDGDESKYCYQDNTPSDGSGCSDGPPNVTVCGTCGIWYDNSYPIDVKMLK